MIWLIQPDFTTALKLSRNMAASIVNFSVEGKKHSKTCSIQLSKMNEMDPVIDSAFQSDNGNFWADFGDLNNEEYTVQENNIV